MKKKLLAVMLSVFMAASALPEATVMAAAVQETAAILPGNLLLQPRIIQRTVQSPNLQILHQIHPQMRLHRAIR